MQGAINPNDAINNLMKVIGDGSEMNKALENLKKALIKRSLKLPISGKLSEVVISNGNEITIRIPGATDQDVKDFIDRITDHDDRR